jgi:hypothetical protein
MHGATIKKILFICLLFIVCLLRDFLKFLDALQFSCEKRMVASRLSVRPLGTSGLPPGGFSYIENVYQKLSTPADFG